MSPLEKMFVARTHTHTPRGNGDSWSKPVRVHGACAWLVPPQSVCNPAEPPHRKCSGGGGYSPSVYSFLLPGVHPRQFILAETTFQDIFLTRFLGSGGWAEGIPPDQLRHVHTFHSEREGEKSGRRSIKGRVERERRSGRLGPLGQKCRDEKCRCARGTHSGPADASDLDVYYSCRAEED